MTMSATLPPRGGATGTGRALRPGLVVDVGSARTLAWTPGRGVFLDVPTVTVPGVGASHPVRRGAVVDPDGAARMLDRLLGDRIRPGARPLVTVTTPLLAGTAHCAALLAALEVLRPRSVTTVPAVQAAALAAGGDLTRPLLVVDVGAQLTEVALLVDGEVADAYRTELGVADLGGAVDSRELVQAVTGTATRMLRTDRTSESLDALQRGVLLVGGGALRPEVVYGLSNRLGVRVRPAPAPHTAAVRGAATVPAVVNDTGGTR